jgi:hypothetical protein
MLGSSGAGKTVFLASLFKHLMIQGEKRFFIEVEDNSKRKLLNNIYTKVISEDSWPPATRYNEISEWTFTCCVRTENFSIHPACRFTYLDYAGGRLTDIAEQSEGDFKLEDEVQKADALLGLLDGRKILALMSNANQLDIDLFLKKDLPSMLELMQRCKSPIHFVISKWDLFEGKFSLKQIRDRLLQIYEFKELIDIRTNSLSPVRLIPVSSVGLNFATPQPNGGMKKITGAIPHPLQVEVPLACVLPDGLSTRIKQLQEQHEQFKKLSEPAKSNLPFLSQVIETTISLLSHLLPEEYRVGGFILNKFVSLASGGLRRKDAQRTEQFRRQRDASLIAVKNEKTALDHTMNSFLEIQSSFIDTFPDSELLLP